MNERTGRPLACLLAASLAVVCGASSIAATPLDQLLTLPGDSGWIRYVPGSLERATSVQGWLEDLATLAAKEKLAVVSLGGLVLDRETWESARLGRPYGLPEVQATGVLALPATGDASTVALWRGLLADGGLPAVERMPFTGSPEEAQAMAAADLLGRLEGGRELARLLGLRPREPWLFDLFGHLLTVAAGDEATMLRLVSFYQGVPRGAGPALEGFAAGMPFGAWLAAQPDLLQGAIALAEDLPRRRPLRHLVTLQAKRGGSLTAADLAAEHPEFRRWLAAARAGRAAAPSG